MKAQTQKFNLRLPMDLMQEAKAQAEALGVSLNAFCLFAIAEQVKRTRRQLRAPPAPSRVQATSRKAAAVKVGRNDLCPCGSGKKAKHCHPENC